MVSASGGDPCEAYKMDKDIHGIALIISNTEFEKETGLNDRYGGDKDEQALQELFEMLHYKAVLLKNLKAAQIEIALRIITGDLSFDELTDRADIKKLEILKAEDCLVSRENDSFVLCVMSHGEWGVVLGTDGETFKVKEICPIVGNCELLSNKPKMVFMQACGGGDMPPDKQIPVDIFMSFSTSPGDSAFRDDDGSGSWYVKDSCSVLKESYTTTDLVLMITIVHLKMSERVGKDDDGSEVTQSPWNWNTLKFNVYFQ